MQLYRNEGMLIRWQTMEDVKIRTRTGALRTSRSSLLDLGQDSLTHNTLK